MKILKEWKIGLINRWKNLREWLDACEAANLRGESVGMWLDEGGAVEKMEKNLQIAKTLVATRQVGELFGVRLGK